MEGLEGPGNGLVLEGRQPTGPVVLAGKPKLPDRLEKKDGPQQLGHQSPSGSPTDGLDNNLLQNPAEVGGLLLLMGPMEKQGKGLHEVLSDPTVEGQHPQQETGAGSLVSYSNGIDWDSPDRVEHGA